MPAFTFTIVEGADRSALQRSRVGPRDKLNYVQFVVADRNKDAVKSRTLTTSYDVRVERMIAKGEIVHIEGIAFTVVGERPCRVEYDHHKRIGRMIIYE